MNTLKIISVLLITISLLFTGAADILGEEENTAYESEADYNNPETIVSADEESSTLGGVYAGMISDDASLQGMELAAQDDQLQLYIDPDTTATAVKHTASGQIWWSNPPNRTKDPVAKGLNLSKLSSQITLTYFNAIGQSTTLDNFSDSIRHGQFEIESMDNGVRIIYEIGRKVKILVLPQLISSERFESLIIDKLEDEADRRNVKNCYQFLTLEGADEEKRMELLEEYPMLENNDLYKLRPASGFVTEELSGLIEKTGYTLEDMNHDHTENNVDLVEESITIKVPLEYTLEDGTLVAKVSIDEIEHPEGIYIHQIQLLEFFGAADTEEQGYIFVPDGSGSLIYLNNGKETYRSYEIRVYGNDNAIPRSEIIYEPYYAHFPVFGLKQGDKAFFAVIEDADAYSVIKADVSGRVNNYNNVFSEFTLISKHDLRLDDKSTRSVPIYQKEYYHGDIKIRYGFLLDDDSSYSGMARYYQNYLVKKGILKSKSRTEGIPFYLELTGAVDSVRSILGVPVRVTESLTTYKQAASIIQKLKDAGIGNINMRYNGWFNGGVSHNYPSSIRFERKLGGRKQFEKLTEFLTTNNIGFYPRVDFQYVKESGLFDGFSGRLHAVRLINRETAKVYKYCVATFQQLKDKGFRYILRPDRIAVLVGRFLRQYLKYDITGIDIAALASEINSDFNENRFIDRQRSMDMVMEGLDIISDSGLSIMADKPNSSTLSHIGHALNSPMYNNGINITDESIPFYQMVLSGYVSFAGEPINLSTRPSKSILKTIETGGGIYYSWIYEDNNIVKGTEYDYLYSVSYEKWIDEGISLYHELNDALGDSCGTRILSHEKLMDGVYKTTFETGKQVIVNYNKYEVNAGGQPVAAECYLVLTNQ